MNQLFRDFIRGAGGSGAPHDPNVINVPRIQIPKPPWALFAVIAGVIALFLLAKSMIYTVGTDEVGLILRFGAFTGTPHEPGLHGKMPFGIDRLFLVPVRRQLKEEFGFRTKTAGVRTTYEQGNFEDESLMLTGDLNAANVEWIVQYRITDPYKYLFRVRNVTGTFRDLSEAMMRTVVGDRTVNEILTVGRQEIADEVGTRLQKLADQYEMGVAVDQVILQDVTPPTPVKPSFNEVNQAQQEREKLINQARAEYNQIIPRARGEAEQTIQQAQGYAIDRVNRAKGEATRFQALVEEYRKAPAVTRRRLYLETMGDILPKVERKIILDDKARNVLPLLDLKEMKAP